MKKIMVIYPPGGLFQRGEERCQININSSSVNSNRPCNDLGYISSILKQNNYNVFLKDYQGENLSFENLLADFKNIQPDVVFISIVNSSIDNDIAIIQKLKKEKNNTIFILKGALFFNPNSKLLSKINLHDIDYLIGAESEFIIKDLIDAHFNNKNELKNIEGISYKIANEWKINKLIHFKDELDNLPFPDRSSMKNELYINPKTNNPIATIVTSKGCPYSCTYCLSPIISGKKLRMRSNESIISEIEDCINNYNINEFFFRSDTFSANKQRVIEFCNILIKKGLNKKINWFTTARVDNLDEEMAKKMKEAGCSLVAIGFEAGSNEMLNFIDKKTTIEMNINASKICKKYGLEILGYFLFGFPIEDEEYLKKFKKHIFKINADYIEISIVIPFPNTPIYEEIIKQDSNIPDVIGCDSYDKIYQKYCKLPPEKLLKFRKNILLNYYLRPSYIIKKISKIHSKEVFLNYFKYGMRLIKNLIFN